MCGATIFTKNNFLCDVVWCVQIKLHFFVLSRCIKVLLPLCADLHLELN